VQKHVKPEQEPQISFEQYVVEVVRQVGGWKWAAVVAVVAVGGSGWQKVAVGPF
jgi:hypothetical protein